MVLLKHDIITFDKAKHLEYIFNSKIGLRFFNNMAVPIHTTEESIEALKAVYESFAAAMNLHGLGKSTAFT